VEADPRSARSFDEDDRVDLYADRIGSPLIWRSGSERTVEPTGLQPVVVQLLISHYAPWILGRGPPFRTAARPGPRSVLSLIEYMMIFT
jgi:hypothetical protein